MTTRAWVRDQNVLMFRHSSRTRELNDSTYPLRQGSPGAMKCRSMCPVAHSLIAAQAVQFGDQVLAGDGTLDQSAEAFAGVLVDDRDELDRPAVGGGVELEVSRPHAVGRVGGR